MTTDIKKTTFKQLGYVQQERIQKQKEYVDKRQGGGGGLFDADLTVKTMRSVRYTSEAHALSDIIDNSIEAGATQVHIATKVDKNKVTEIAIIDDASGMLPDFLPWAASWGGSAQHGDEGQRNVFGRFGFGLPTASINRGTAYDIISRTDNNDFTMVSIDIRNLDRGSDGLPIQPTPVAGRLPEWVVDYLIDDNNRFRGGVDSVRTVVIWRNLDRLKSKSLNEFNSLVQNHLGVTYMAWLPQVTLAVNGTLVEPVDLNFTTPGARYFDVDGTRAEDHGSIVVPVKDVDGVEHNVTIRLSRLPVSAYAAEYKSGVKGRPSKIRQKLRGEYLGIFVTRHDRFIETWSPRGVKGISWNNYMRQVCTHLDFPPQLDEMFGITPDKQTINPRDEVIDALNARGVFKAIKDLYDEVEKERARLKTERDAALSELEGGSSITEAVMEKFDKAARPSPKSDEELERRREEAKKNLERAVKDKAAKANVPEDLVRDALTAETEQQRFKVELVSLGDFGPFYQPQQRGLQTVLQINVDHKFFTDVYSKIPAGSHEVRTGIELLLFTLAYSELDAVGERAAFYLNERIAWSRHLLTQMQVHDDVIASSSLGAFVGANSQEANDEEDSSSEESDD